MSTKRTIIPSKWNSKAQKISRLLEESRSFMVWMTS
ncbi:hypothetical protein [Chryseobacterium daecheongense]